MRVTPINVAEAIIAPLFDHKLSGLGDYAVESHDGLPAAISQSWDCSVIAGRSGDFTLRWAGRLEFQGYDRFRFFVNYPPEFRLSATATLNGREFRLFDDVPGQSFPFEPTSPVFGRARAVHVMTRLDLHFRGPSVRDVRMSLNWFGLVSSDREPDLERQLPRYSPEWPGLLNPSGRAAIAEPLFGSREFLERLPEHARQPRFSELLSGLRQAAAGFQSYSPEPDIREYVPCGEHFYRYVRVRDRNRPRWDHPQRIQVLALAGYLDGNPEWSRLAARHVLALAHTPHWFEGPQANCPGSDWHHVCFLESHCMDALCHALPFLGDWLTPAGRDKVLDRMEEAWELVNAKCVEPGYRWYMNQGIVGNSLRLIGAAFLHLAGRGEHYAAAVEQSYRDHTTVVNNYLAEDGHCSEGGYFTYSFYSTVPMWIVYSVFTGRPLADVVPERFKRTTAFVEAATSSAFPAGAMAAVGANGVGVPWSGMLLAILRTACGWPAGGRWLRDRLERANPDLGADEVLALLTLVPETLRDEPVRAGVQGCQASGLVAYQFRHPRCGKLVLEAERPATGHHHYDRGGVILEDAGELLLPDLGNLQYSDLRSAFMGNVDRHNLAHPVDLEMRLMDRPGSATPVPRARIERADETADGFEFAIDVAPIYGAEVRVGRRDGALRLADAGGTLTLRDRWQFAQPHPVDVIFNSYAPWSVRGDGMAETRVGSTRLEVRIREAGGATLECRVHDDRVDARLRQVWSLCWRTPAQLDLDLDSTVSWSRRP